MSVTEWFFSWIVLLSDRFLMLVLGCPEILRTTAFITNFDPAHVVLLHCWLTDYKSCWCAQCFFFFRITEGQIKHCECGIDDRQREKRRERWGSRKQERKRQIGGNRVKDGDGMGDDFALLCVILCLLKIFSYLTCALLYSPLHQV